jgi:hypothetical protein
MSFLQLYQVLVELLARWEIIEIPPVPATQKNFFIDKALNADTVGSPEDRNSSSDEDDDENTGSVCE